MIARIWRGWTAVGDADEYASYVERTGLAGYRSTPGNLGARILRREVDGRAEFVVLSFWESLDAIRGFAGDDPEAAVFYPEDDRFLLQRELRVAHYDLVAEA